MRLPFDVVAKKVEDIALGPYAGQLGPANDRISDLRGLRCCLHRASKKKLITAMLKENSWTFAAFSRELDDQVTIELLKERRT